MKLDAADRERLIRQYAEGPVPLGKLKNVPFFVSLGVAAARPVVIASGYRRKAR